MTAKNHEQSNHLTPFILRFAERMNANQPQLFRYDETRQIAQVHIDGNWIDTPDAPGEVFASTKKTAVDAETTDDQ